MKKKIKINFYGLPENVCEEYLFLKILKERYDVIISDSPDYLFCGPMAGYGYTQFEGIRIFYGFECFYPDMNLFDYALSCTELCENERHLRIFLPIYNEDILKGWDNEFSDMNQKTEFCNYIYSHAGTRERTEIYDIVNRYKHVDAAGKWLNNMGGFTPGHNTAWDEKIEFQKKYKFSIAVENFSYPYYCTEKITDAFRAKTIPIYYGDPKIGEYINEKSFINMHSYKNFEDALEDIKKIDEDDDRYMEMINQPKFTNSNFLNDEINKMRIFLYNIFDKDYHDAFRRPQFFWPKKHELQLNMYDFFNEMRQKGERFKSYFYENCINCIAIYGRGEFYRRVEEEIYESHVEVKCFIETFPTTEFEKGIPIYSVNDKDKYYSVDAIIVTPGYVFEEVKLTLERIGVDKRIISLEELIRRMR